jgi:hypothetical protein
LQHELQLSVSHVLSPPASSLSIGVKLEILRQVEEMQQGGSSLRNAARAFNIQGNQIRRWRKQFDTGNAGVLRRNMKVRSFCTGSTSFLETFEDEILQWLFSLQEQGLPVLIGMVVLKARQVVGSSFQSKSEQAKCMIWDTCFATFPFQGLSGSRGLCFQPAINLP